MLKTVENLFKEWNDNGIGYCHWKSSDHLDATVNGITDIDVLVSRDDADKVESIIINLGFQRFDTVYLRSYPGIMDYVCLDKETAKWVHIHLHYQLALGDRWVKAYWLPLEKQVLSRSVFSNKYQSYVVHPCDELYLLCARMSLKINKPFNNKGVWKEFLHIRSAIQQSYKDYKYFDGVYDDLELMYKYALSENPLPKELNKHAVKVKRSLRQSMRYSLPGFYLYSNIRMIYRYYVEFRRRFLKNFKVGRRKIPRGGKIISFIGIDGSGKTSGVARMEKLFVQQMNVTTVFLGNGQSGASWYRNLFFKLFGVRAKWKSHKQLNPDIGKKENFKVPWYYSLWILLCLLDKEKNLKEAMKARANGSLVLSDRWPQDKISATLDGPRIYGKNNLNFLAKYVSNREKRFLELSKTIIPDAILRFNVSPEKACFRKPNEFTLEVALQNGKLLEQLKWDDANIIDINADDEIGKVDYNLRAAIWKSIQGKKYV